MIPTFDDVMCVTREVSSSLMLEDSEAQGLYDAIVQVPRDGILVETGCQLGRSSSMITQLQQAIGFHSIHIDPYTTQSDWLGDWVRMMHRVGGDHTHEFTLACMRTEQAAWLLRRLAPFDMAYIDGDHELNGVKLDLTLIADNVRSGGLLAVHDYTSEWLPGVRAGVDEYMQSGLWELVGAYGRLLVWRRK